MAKRTTSDDEPRTEEPTSFAGQEPAGAPAQQPELPTQCVYLGPSLAENGVLYAHGQIFNNGLPAPWREKAAADPDFRLLLSPFAKTPRVRKEMADGQSMYALAAKRVLDRRKTKKQSV